MDRTLNDTFGILKPTISLRRPQQIKLIREFAHQIWTIKIPGLPLQKQETSKKITGKSNKHSNSK